MYLVTYSDGMFYTYGQHKDVAIFSNKEKAIEFIKEEFELEWDYEKNKTKDGHGECEITELPFYS